MTNPNDREPNFRDKEGNLFLVRCFVCRPTGKENYMLSVASGQCAWCGWTEAELTKGESKS